MAKETSGPRSTRVMRALSLWRRARAAAEAPPATPPMMTIRVGFMGVSGVEGGAHLLAEAVEGLAFQAVEDLAALDARLEKAGFHEFGDVAGRGGLGEGQLGDEIRAAEFAAMGEVAEDFDPRRMGKRPREGGQPHDPVVKGVELGEGHKHISDVR